MPIRHHFFAVLVAAFWGANYVACKEGMSYFPPIFYTMIRFWLVALVLLPFLPQPDAKDVPKNFNLTLTLNAFVLCVGHMAFILVAIQHGLSIASSVVTVQLGVPFSCILGVIFLGDRIGKWRMLGLVISFIGVVMIAGSPNITEHWGAFFVALGATFAWAVSNVMMKQLPPIHAFRLFSLLSIFAIPMLACTTYIFEYEQWRPILNAPFRAWMGIFYSVFGSTIIAYGGWAFLIQRYNISTIAPYTLLVPVFGILSGVIYYGDMPSHEVIVGGAVIILGVAMITLRRPKIFIRGGSVS